MSTRQYIGARYVPKFFDWGGSAEWRAGVAYEALTVVTRNGNSYTSKIPVPSNIGEPESNPDYWVATGLYNAQVESIRQGLVTAQGDINNIEGEITTINGAIGDLNNDVDAVENSVDGLTTQIGYRSNKIAVFIGDSYSEGYGVSPTQSFPSLICSRLGVTLKNFSIGGTGYLVGGTGQKYIDQLNSAIGDTSFENTDVAYVFVCGGRNDASQYPNESYDNITAAINTVVGTAIGAFTNAQVYVIPMLYDAGVAPQPIMWWYMNIIRGLTGLYRCVHVMRHTYQILTGRFGYISDDNIHPNVTGHKVIASSILDFMFGGTGALNTENFILPALTGASGHCGMYCDGDEIYVYCGDVVLSQTFPANAGLFGITVSTNNIPCYFGQQKIYGWLYGDSNSTFTGANSYPISLEMTADKTFIIRSQYQSIPAGNYHIQMRIPFGRYFNSATG